MTGPDAYVVDFPTLGFLAGEWIARHCVIPDREQRGEPFRLGPWQAWNIANHYRVRPTAQPGQLSTAFHYRRSQTVRPQKSGKSPFVAAVVCLEAVGPALFAGWANGEEAYYCSEHGCGCGWVYDYEPGEPMGRPWYTPLIQITATSEEQTDNIYDALRPMIELGRLRELIPKTGEEFIRLPNGGRIDVVTANAQSRLGQRVTFVAQDETGIWVKQNGMIKVAETQRRGLAGMGGRAWETTNAWNPAEDSVAQRTFESKATDIFRDFPQAPSGLSYRVKAERRKIHRYVYVGAPWVDLDAIEGEAAELLEKDPTQAERFFGNRAVAGDGIAFDTEQFASLARPDITVPRRAKIVLGFDGARWDDSTALVAVALEGPHIFTVAAWDNPGDPDWEVPEDEVDAAVDDAFSHYRVLRMYADPPYWETAVARWASRYGDKRVFNWHTHRPRQTGNAVRSFDTAIRGGLFTHDGDPQLIEHVANARRRDLTIRDDDGRPLWVIRKERPKSPRKIDRAMAALLAWEAYNDAVKSGARTTYFAYTA